MVGFEKVEWTMSDLAAGLLDNLSPDLKTRVEEMIRMYLKEVAINLRGALHSDDPCAEMAVLLIISRLVSTTGSK